MEAIQHHSEYENVHPVERVASVIAGGVFAAAAIRSVTSREGKWRGVLHGLVASGLLKRGLTGRCAIYKTLGIRTAPRGEALPYELGVRACASVTLPDSRDKVFQFWRRLENLPLVMRHLQSVEQGEDKRSHWIAEGPAGNVEWDAELINEIPNELIAWHSLPGSDVESAGSVRFRDAANGGTEIRVELQYNPPAGAIGAYVARLLGSEPEQEIQSDLDRLKRLLEAGEFALSDPPIGQGMESI